MTDEFDRFLRYDELVGVARRAGGGPPGPRRRRDVRAQLRGPRPEARHRHRRLDGRPRHQAGALGRRLDPRRGADRHRRRLLRCCSTSSTATRPATPSSPTALRTRTFYVVPRVNPDGAEWALADPPRFRRSSVRPWPWADAHRWPGAHVEDVDGDGRVLQMRIPDPDGAWMPHPDDARLLVPVPFDGRSPPARRATGCSTRARSSTSTASRSRRPGAPEGLDMNRNFPAGWGTGVPRLRRPPAVRAGDRRPRAGDRRPPQRLRLQRLPHERRGAAAAVVDGRRLGAAAGRRLGRGSSSARSGRR